MGKKYQFMLVILLVFMTLGIYMEATKPAPLNWQPNYTKKVATPLGSKAIHMHFEKLMERNPHIVEINKSAYEAFLNDEQEFASVLYFNHYVLHDEESIEQLLKWVASGNTAFISSKTFPEKLKDTLGVETTYFSFSSQFSYENKLSLTHASFSEQTYATASDYEAYYFKEIDSTAHKILGHITPIATENTLNNIVNSSEKQLINFIEVPFENGKIYLHTFPEAFGNHFFIHEDNYAYTTNALQYIHWQKPVYIDLYYKAGKESIDSLLYYVVQNRSLKWAYYTAIFASLLFVFVEGKRKQKSIPILLPLPNQTYEFTKTVAQMFLDKKAHKAIADKQIKQFLNFIRTHFHLSTREINKRFYEELSMKSNVEMDTIKKLFELIALIEKQPELEKEQLMKLEQQIRNIKGA